MKLFFNFIFLFLCSATFAQTWPSEITFGGQYYLPNRLYSNEKQVRYNRGEGMGIFVDAGYEFKEHLYFGSKADMAFLMDNTTVDSFRCTHLTDSLFSSENWTKRNKRVRCCRSKYQ